MMPNALEQLLHSATDKRVRLLVPDGAVAPRVAQVLSFDESTLTAILDHGDGVPVPHRGVPLLPRKLRAGDLVVFDQNFGGWNMPTHILGDVPGGLPSETIRASGGDDAPEFRRVIGLADPAIGIRILLPDPLYLLSSLDGDGIAADTSQSHVLFEGMGGGLHSSADPIQGSRIHYGGPANGKVFRWGIGPAVPADANEIVGGGLKNLVVHGGGLADIVIQVRSMSRLRFENLWVGGGTDVQLEFTQRDMTTVGVNNYNTSRLHIVEMCTFSAIGSAGGIRMRSNPNANGGENTYGVVLMQNHVKVVDGIGIDYWSVDDIWEYATEFGVGGTGERRRFRGTATGTAHVARGVMMFGGYGGQMTAEATGKTAAARQILLVGMNTEDITNYRPTIEPGAGLRYLDDHGRHTFRRDPSTTAEIDDDFHGGSGGSTTIGKEGWTLLGGTATKQTSTDNHNGILRVDTGAGAGTLAGIAIPTWLTPANGFWATIIFQLNQTDGDTMCRVGFGQGAGVDPPVDGIYLEKVYGDTQWFAVCRSGGVQTRSTQLGTVVANTWVYVQIRRRNSTEIGFTIGDFLNGADSRIISTNVPTGIMGAICQIKNQVAVSKTMDIDRYQASIIGLTRT